MVQAQSELGRSAARRLAPLLAPLALAAALAGAAVVTVQKAGCDDPGTYVPTPTGIELVGGCIAPDVPRLVPDQPPGPSDRRG